MSNVVILPRKQNIKKTAARSTTKFTRRQRLLRKSAYATLGVAALLTCLSFTHLATGTELVTSCDAWAGWAMAAGIDLGFGTLEVATIIAPIPAVTKWAKPLILATLALSATMNAFAFAQNAEGWKLGAAIVLGGMIPALIYAQIQVASAMLRAK
jgi:hypothetical protein